MLDRPLRRLIDPVLDVPAAQLARWRVSANMVTVAGFVLGTIGCVLIALHQPQWGLVFLLGNRFADGLDGCVARKTNTGNSDVGGFLDFVFDLLFYGGVPFAFAIADPINLLPACFLLYTFMGTTGSFLVYAVISAKRGVTSDAEGKKSFFYDVGLMEGSETILFFSLICLFPQSFVPLAWGYSILCCLTILLRLIVGILQFRETP